MMWPRGTVWHGDMARVGAMDFDTDPYISVDIIFLFLSVSFDVVVASPLSNTACALHRR
jgi:hypothetical protein